MIALYRSLLRLYPVPHRFAFADEMLCVFLDAEAAARARGPVARSRFYAREISGLVVGALRERLHLVASAHPWVARAERTFAMRSQFRFSWSAVGFMTLVLGVIVVLIAKAQGIALSFVSTVPHRASPVGGNFWTDWPAHYGMLEGIALWFAVAWLAGLAAWGIVYALRRSGVHRLDQAQTWPAR